MNIENLEVGKIFKNYKAICEALGINTKTGKSKQLQIKDWERYFKYSKDGHNFIIKEIYDNPEEKVDLRVNGNNTLPHAQKMEDMLLYILSKQEDGELFLTINKLLLEMNMINHNYAFGNRNKKKVSSYLDIEESFVEEFFNTSRRTFKNNIESMLDRLENKSIIYWHKVKTVCVARSITHSNELGDIKVTTKITLDEYDNEEIELSTSTNEVLDYRIATDEEIELILEVEDEVMRQLNCKNKQELVVKGKWAKFMRQTNEILQERANILFRYDSYKIIRNLNKIQREVDKIEPLTEDEIIKSLNMFSLNVDIQNQLLGHWEKRHENAIKEVVLGKVTQISKLRSDENFLENGCVLIDNFICGTAPKIVKDLKRIKVSYS